MWLEARRPGPGGIEFQVYRLKDRCLLGPCHAKAFQDLGQRQPIDVTINRHIEIMVEGTLCMSVIAALVIYAINENCTGYATPLIPVACFISLFFDDLCI
jgi:hypothetical protein